VTFQSNKPCHRTTQTSVFVSIVVMHCTGVSTPPNVPASLLVWKGHAPLSSHPNCSSLQNKIASCIVEFITTGTLLVGRYPGLACTCRCVISHLLIHECLTAPVVSLHIRMQQTRLRQRRTYPHRPRSNSRSVPPPAGNLLPSDCQLPIALSFPQRCQRAMQPCLRLRAPRRPPPAKQNRALSRV